MRALNARPMKEIEIAEFAAREGISRQHARLMAGAGKIKARRVGSGQRAIWLIDAAARYRRTPGRRGPKPARRAKAIAG